MNERAHSLMVKLQTSLDMLPGARSIGLHAFERWSLGLITASSDEAVIAIANELGLGAIEVETNPGCWWYRAVSERDRGGVRVAVAGPHHLRTPQR
jgi:hypothetical protein